MFCRCNTRSGLCYRIVLASRRLVSRKVDRTIRLAISRPVAPLDVATQRGTVANDDGMKGGETKRVDFNFATKISPFSFRKPFRDYSEGISISPALMSSMMSWAATAGRISTLFEKKE